VTTKSGAANPSIRKSWVKSQRSANCECQEKSYESVEGRKLSMGVEGARYDLVARYGGLKGDNLPRA